jgi:LuxR family maltose regulon positive regulatory protein
MPSHLLHTKLNVPPLPPSLVPRPHLIERLNQSLQLGHKLTLLSAPAGYGKSTLILDWLKGQQNRVAWLSLDKNDDDPRRFLIYVVAALNHALPDFGADLLRLLQTPGQAPALEPASTIALNELAALEIPIILTLDHYQVIEATAIHGTLSYWLDHLPANLHLVITSRNEPNLPLSRLRARGQLIELNLQALRFTLQETDRYLRHIMGFDLSEEGVKTLAERTEGWAAGLQLAALSLQDAANPADFVASFSGSNRMVFDYLADEVLAQQPPEIRGFLLQTSILDRLSASLCDAVLETVDQQPPIPSQQILEEIDATGLFLLPLDNDRRWYRYHPLFADLLRERLQRTYPERLSMLHSSASQWYATNYRPEEAIQHAFAADDTILVVHLLEQNAQEMIWRGEVVRLLGWLQTLPREAIQTNPRLGLSLALTRLLAVKLECLDAVLSPLQTAEKSLSATDNPEKARLLAEMNSVRAAVLVEQGKIAQGLALAELAYGELSADQTRYGAFSRSSLASTLALAYRDQGQTEKAAQVYAEARAISEANENIMLALFAAYELGKLRIEQGQLGQAEQIYRASMTWLENRFGAAVIALPLSGAAHIGLGRLLLEWNQLDEAREHLETGVERAQHQGGLGIDRDGLLALSLVYQTQNEPDQAFETMAQAVEHARSSPRPDALLRAQTYQVRLWLAQGNTAAAARWAEQLERTRWDQYPAEITAVALARVHLVQGKPQLALDLLTHYLPIVEMGGRHGRLLEILALEALALHNLGQGDQALSSLEHSLSLAGPEGYARLYLDLGQAMVWMSNQSIRS